MQLRYNYRVYPTPSQQQALARSFGCARVVFNDGLRLRQAARAEGLPYLSDAELSKLLTAAKLTPERAWLGEVSFVVQTTDQPHPEIDSEVGIDLGLTHFAVLSDGTKVAAPKFLRRAARKLSKLQKSLSRKAKGSNNRKKAVVKVARAHARVADTRRDWQHKLSTAIIRDNQAVYVEDLCVVGLGRTRLAKSVHDAGWASFTAMLEYKAARRGRSFGRVDRFFPSTRMCCDCGRINDKMALNVRAWDCPCGAAHDRDVNAAMNVLAAGRAERLNDRGARVRPALVLAARREAVIHPDAACSTRSAEGIPVLLDGGDRQRRLVMSTASGAYAASAVIFAAGAPAKSRSRTARSYPAAAG